MLCTLMLLALNASDISPIVKPSVLEPAFGSTIVSTYPDGRISKLWLNRDGTFTAEGRRHDSSGGRWSLKAASICLRQTKPFPIPFAQYCAPIPQDGVTAGWKGKAVTGEPITIQLAPGR